MTVSASAALFNSNRTVSLFDGPAPGDIANAIQIRIEGPGGQVIASRIVTIGNDPRNTPGQSNFADGEVIPLTGGGFAIKYASLFANPPTFSNTGVVIAFDRDGNPLGPTIREGNSGSSLDFPRDADVDVTALADGGFVVASTHEPDGHAEIAFYDGRATPLGELVFAARPSDITDTGAGVAITIGGERLVVDSHGAVLEGAAPILTRQAGDGGEALTGISGPSDLTGGAGADTLDGGAGPDVLVGGGGADRFVFHLDGSSDVARDFSHADSFAVRGSDGASAATPASILTLDARTHILSLDVDGAQAPAADIAVAVLPGVATLRQSDLAPGFQPGIVRYINADGSHSDLTFDYSGRSFLQASADYNPAGQLTNYIIDYLDGRKSVTFFDFTGQEPWERASAEYDAQGRLAYYGVLYDDGARTLRTFDVDNHFPWSQAVDEYDPSGALIRQTFFGD